MKKVLFVMAVLGFASAVNASIREHIVFLTWEEYIDKEVVAEFEERFQIDVKFSYFEHDEMRDELVTLADGAKYDVMLVDGQSISTYRRLNWIAPITETEIPNLKNHTIHRWKEVRPTSTGFGVPYAWGTAGIAYREDMIKSPINSYMDILRPPDYLKGKIMMSPQIFELLPAALTALGFDQNSVIKKEIEQAKALLLEQQSHVYSYKSNDLDASNELVRGEVAVAYAYSGDALMLADIDERIKYIVPKEGSPLWIDFLTVSSSSRKKDLAFKFINFLSETDITRRNSESLYTASFNEKANKSLPEEIQNNTTVFYSDLSKLFVVSETDTKTSREYMRVLQRLNIEEFNRKRESQRSQ